MRYRIVLPEFFTDRKVAALGPTTALVYQALWVRADDGGTARIDPDLIWAEHFARWEEVRVIDVIYSLVRLSESSMITPYLLSDHLYAKIPKFVKHQRINRPSRWRYPADGEPITDLFQWFNETQFLGQLSETIQNTHAPASSIQHPAASIKKQIPSTLTEPSTKDSLSLIAEPKSNNHLPTRNGDTLQAVTEFLASILDSVAADHTARITAVEQRQIAAAIVFQYWALKMGHPKALLDAKRENRIIKHLKGNGDNANELLYVIDGYFKDAVLQRLYEEKGQKYDGIQTIFRDREMVERLAGHCDGYRKDQPHPIAEKYLSLGS